MTIENILSALYFVRGGCEILIDECDNQYAVIINNRTGEVCHYRWDYLIDNYDLILREIGPTKYSEIYL